MPHEPATQVALPLAGVGHTLPQVPQFEVSVPVLTQTPAQSLNPVLQETPQAPFAHVALPLDGTEHAMPQPLQLAGSVLVSTQAVPHFVVPDAQVISHLPAEQTSVALQAVPHPPQLAALVCVSTHWSPHFTKPVLQVNPQVLAAHVATPLAGTLQTFPQVPQFWGSAAVSMQLVPHLS
jgi:hypothetical protein